MKNIPDPDTFDFTATPLPWTVDGRALVAANGVDAGDMRSPALAERVATVVNAYKEIHDETVKVLSDLEKGRAAADEVLNAAEDWSDADTNANWMATQRLSKAVEAWRREKERQAKH